MVIRNVLLDTDSSQYAESDRHQFIVIQYNDRISNIIGWAKIVKRRFGLFGHFYFNGLGDKRIHEWRHLTPCVGFDVREDGSRLIHNVLLIENDTNVKPLNQYATNDN